MEETKDLQKLLNGATFVKEAHRLDQLPDDFGHEIAFVGRSNAGKSSVINCLCRRKNLARTSRTPGRTQQFVVFELSAEMRVIDLPGFGFAKVSKSKRSHWDQVIPMYLETRRSLLGLVLVVDSRHPLKTEEMDVIGWCTEVELPVLVLLNKIDKLNQKERAKCRKIVGNALVAHHDLVSIQEFSAIKATGVPQALAAIQQWRSAHDQH